MSEAPIKRTELQWDRFFYAMAEKVAELSKDPDRRVGAVLVSPDRRQISLGYNGFPPEVPDLPSHLADKAFKLKHMLHAERNCLAQSPFPTKDCTLYITRFPCEPCALLIADADVARVVAPVYNPEHPRWGRSWEEAELLLREVGILVRKIV